jgi:hypothetical protein
MARACTVCTLSTAGAVNQSLRDGRSAREVASEFGLSYDALTRHARNHLAAVPITGSGDLLGSALPSRDPLEELTAALRTRALSGSDAASREYRLALAAQTAARHAATPHRALTDEPEWIALRTIMLKALQPFPEARIAVADALAESRA